MLDDTRGWLVGQLKGIRPAFASKNPHFNFITVHYFWIIGATLFSSIAIFIGGKNKQTYIDSLMFGSGANTQAGLNPIDVNSLNGFQQSMIYTFALLSNPISLHACVVFLRLYWFEKRFQDLARDARSRRRPLSRSKSKARNDLSQIERQIGVGDRRITVVPPNGQSQRLTHDGMLLENRNQMTPARPSGSGSNESDTTMTDEVDPLDPVGKPAERRSNRKDAIGLDDDGGINVLSEYQISGIKETTNGNDLLSDAETSTPEGSSGEKRSDEEEAPAEAADPSAHHGGQAQTAITFADTVMRSDGMGTDATKFPRHQSNAGHIAILERQRNQDNEVLRIPGPRDTERGLGPRRLLEDEQDEDDNYMARQTTRGSRMFETGRIRGRQPTITIAEPDRQFKNDIDDDDDDAEASGSGLRLRRPRIFSRSQSGAHEDNVPRDHRPVRTKTMESIRSALTRDKAEDMPYLSYTPTMGRNSNFLGLTLEQREELGGIEYRSLRTLALVLLFYFWVFHLLALVCLLPYILHNNRYGAVLDRDSVGRTWWAFWTSNMAFMDVGFSLTPDSMNSFQTSKWVLMVMWFFIIIGNTGFPVMLRFIIWVLSKITPRGSGLWEEFMFLLDHPRRCFTLLFPSNATWWLFWILVLLNVIDLVFFVVLDLGSEPIHSLPLSDRIVIGLFQAASTRTAGFSASNIGELHPAMPVLYMIMMYISIFPIAISIRRTNVYEEKSLGVYPEKMMDSDDAPALSYVGTHLRRQLSFDLWYVFLGFFLLAITEAGKIQRREFDLFAVLFEIVSAYGTVGLSLGVASVNASLCSQFSVPGKLIIVAMQIRGRHRALPYGLDRAILLPNESRLKKESEEAEAALARANTMASAAVASGAQRPGTSASHKRSKSRDQTAGSLITSFLHPGPVVHDDLSPPRRPDFNGGHRRTQSVADIRHGPALGPLRTQTVPHLTTNDNHKHVDLEPLAPLRSLQPSHHHPRADTSPFV
ncbi:Low-affinity potassium transport protein [Escovopsis weberi]|uniref:Potassium transport protein n=1 Tax=Escovopsis weberi TaxID=150374 RepID=A0A0M8N1G0_ESCWE|nr:Low-affinity potassium transport protein [Escovopsis weberi]